MSAYSDALEAALKEHHKFDSRGMCRICGLPTLSGPQPCATCGGSGWLHNGTRCPDCTGGTPND